MKYDRLTKRDIHGNAVVFNYTKTTGEFKTVVDRLAELEDKIENGTMVELPCKVGDCIYLIDKNLKTYRQHRCYTIIVERKCGQIIFLLKIGLSSAYIPANSEYVCYTEREAEKRLAELKDFKK